MGRFLGEALQMSDMFLQEPQAACWRRALACGGLFVCVMLAWPPIPVHLVPIRRAERIKQGGDGGRDHCVDCIVLPGSWGLLYGCACSACMLACCHMPRTVQGPPQARTVSVNRSQVDR